MKILILGQQVTLWSLQCQISIYTSQGKIVKFGEIGNVGTEEKVGFALFIAHIRIKYGTRAPTCVAV